MRRLLGIKKGNRSRLQAGCATYKSFQDKAGGRCCINLPVTRHRFSKLVWQKQVAYLCAFRDTVCASPLERTLSLIIVLMLLALNACTGIRTEFYREETKFLYEGGRQYYAQGDYDAALSAFEAVLVIDPDYGPAYAALGNLSMIHEDYPAALNYYRQALKVDGELAPDIKVLMLVAGAHVARAPLTDAGIDLGRVYSLVIADRQSELEALLEKDVPLDLLSADNMSIAPGQRDELLRKIEATVQPGFGSLRFRLLAGYLLFWGQADDGLAAALFEEVGQQLQGRDRQQAMLVLAHLNERRGRLGLAVDAYLSAVAAGLRMTDVAHHLARVYSVDIEAILSADTESETVPPALEPVRIEMTGFLPKPPTPVIGSGVMAPLVEIENLQFQGSPHAF